MRKATRDTDIEEVPLILEGITPPPDPSPPPQQKALTYNPTKPVDPNRRFQLKNQKTDELYKNEAGLVVVFHSKSAAKKARNHLNHKKGAGYYYVVPAPSARDDGPNYNEAMEEAMEAWEGWGGWGGMGCY